MRRLALALPLLLLPALASAHPHVFVTAGVTIVYDGARPVAVRLDWAYDDFFSLLLTSDLGIDLDGDLELQPDEAKTLAAAVSDWPADFTGDLSVEQGGAPVRLGARTDHAVRYEDGLVFETHVRPLQDTGEGPLTVRVFDPYYYTAYEIAGPIRIEGREGCAAEIVPADVEAATEMVQEMLGGIAPGDVGAEEAFPEVGAAFADTITVTCAP